MGYSPLDIKTRMKGNIMLKKVQKIGASLLASVPFAALAAVPEEVTAAITTTKADAVTVGGLMIGVVAAVLVFKFIRGQMH
jgi:hypothetical protein